MSYPKLLGKGSYGEVNQISPTLVEKKMPWYDYKYDKYEVRNIHEAMFLKSMSAPFIPLIKDIKIKGFDIILTQKYCGITLDKYANILSYDERVKEVPSLICQMARILVWLKDHKVAHYDIKPANLCIDKDGNLSLTLIDFGFVGPVCANSPKYFGTQSYGDPSYFKGKKQLTYEYDMMGMGLSLISFINGGDWINSDVWIEGIGSSITYKSIVSKELKKTKISDDEILDLLVAMTDLNENDRIKPMDLYKQPILEIYQKQYPLIRDSPFQKGKSTSINIAPNIKSIAETLGEEYMIGYIAKVGTNVAHEGYRKYSVDQILAFAKLAVEMIFDFNPSTKEIDPTDFITFMNDVEWELYPLFGMVDWNMPLRISETQYEKWVDLCCDSNFVLAPEYAKQELFEKIFGEVSFNMKNEVSISIKPELFDNETIHANTKKANMNAIEHIDKVKKWYMKYGNSNRLKNSAKIVDITVEKNKLKLIFDKHPGKYITDYTDPDKDGNYPILINKKKMLITSKLK
jgi:serine/threonine protein kinase